MAQYNSATSVSWFLPLLSVLFLTWFIKQTLGTWEKQVFSPKPLCVPWTESAVLPKNDKCLSWIKAQRSALFSHPTWLLDKSWPGSSVRGLTQHPASPSPACHSEHPWPGVWQRLQWHCKDETKFHRGPQNFPTKEVKWLIQRLSTWPLSFYSAWQYPEEKKILLLCVRVLWKFL